MKKVMHFSFMFCLLTLSLTACVSTSYNPPGHYQLTTLSQKKLAAQPINKTLLVSQPVATQVYQSRDMLYVDQHYKLSAFAKNDWNAPPTDMLFPLLALSIQNTGYFSAVIPAPSFAYTDWRIDTYLIKLQQNFTQKPSVVELQMGATLVDNKSLGVIGNTRFSVQVAAPEDTPYGGVVAANIACQQMMEEISEWVVETGRQRQ
jgi:cholesterol transport system auxiliary component